jgi:hypothetical protein
MTTRATRVWIGSLITLLVIAAIIAAAFILAQVNRTTTSVGQEPGFVDDPAERARSAGMIETSSAKEAANSTGHDIMSGANVASEQLLSTWVTSTGDEAMEVYASGLTVVTEEPEIGADPVKYYEAVVAGANRPSVYITEINGVQALAVEPNTDELGTNPGLLRFESHGMSVVVSGKDLTVAYLTKVAQQLETVRTGAASE